MLLLGAIISTVDTLSNLSASELLDGIQVGLDVIGLVPGVGEIADGINGLISLARGDYVGAALSFVSIFSLQKEDGSWIDVEMIRPAEYWEAQGAVPGSYVLMQFPELEASGLAKLKSLAACPPIAEGDGLVVTARIVTLTATDLVEIALATGETITGTPPHPIRSIELCTAAGLLIGQSTSWTNFRIASSRAILSSTICCSRQQSYQRVSALTLATVR